MRPKVEAELIRLEQLDIIEKVETADFSTTPIVPVLQAITSTSFIHMRVLTGP